MDPAGHETDNLGGRHEVGLSILLPTVRFLLEMFKEDDELQARLKHMDDVIQKLNVDDPYDFIKQLYISGILNQDFGSFHRFLGSRINMASEAPRGPEQVVRSFDFAIQILQYICSDEYAEKEDHNISITSIKQEISAAIDELGILRNLIRMLFGNGNPLLKTAQRIPAILLYQFCPYFAILLDNRNEVPMLCSYFKWHITEVREGIHSLVKELYDNHRSQELPVLRDDLDEEVVDFFGCLTNNLRDQHRMISSGGNDQIEAAIHELTFLRDNILDILQEDSSAVKEMESLCLSTSALIIKMAFQIYFSRLQTKDVDGTERATNYWSFHLPGLLEAVDFLKQKASDLFTHNKMFSLLSLSPRGNMEYSSNCLIKNLEAASTGPLKHQIETFYKEMGPIIQFLANDDRMEKSQMGFFMARFKELAYRCSLILVSFLAGETGFLWYHKLGMFVVTNEVRMAYKELKSTDKAANIKLVGVNDAALEAIQLLTLGATNLKIVSIVGMPGLGKTTMAEFVYEHPSVNKHFHVRAWCCVSQVYNRETLLVDILSQLGVGKTNSSLENLSGDDLAVMLYRNLKGKRYLIVLDDIWDIEVWQDLENTFPNDHTGSRILFTTRNGDIVRKANSLHLNLRLLSEEESCKLLWFKVFTRGTCPPELSILSRRIARNCKGLPLAVILVAGILKRTKRSKESWEQVAAAVKRFRASKHGDQLDIMQCSNILELSYKHLPRCLKPCFLYFDAFPEDTYISVSKLIQLWISQGFVQLEEQAESYLDELIDRSLVMIAKRSSTGRVKACRVHDVLLGFCSAKSRQEGVLSEESILGGIAHLYCRSLMYYGYGEINSGAGERAVMSARPVFITFKRLTLLNFRSAVPRRLDAGTNYQQPIRLDYGFMLKHEFLRVLDIGKVRMESSADTCDVIRITATLVDLRFLGIRPRRTIIPAEIGNLRKLETLTLTGTIGYIKLPESLWNLSSLRNVLMDHGFFSFQHCSKNFLENFSGHGNLKSVSTLSLQHGDDVGNCILRRLPYIQKLACRLQYSWDDDTNCCLFPELNFLNQLESLKVFLCGRVRFPCKFSLPSNLKKLSLSNSRLPWDAMSGIVRQLPNLEVLKLLNKAFEGREWNMGDGDEFPKLKFLKLESLNIKFWNAEADHFPCLEQLVMLGCPQLEEIPCCFGEIATLQSIEMKWCSSSAMDCVNQILQVQRDFSNDQLKVTLIGSA